MNKITNNIVSVILTIIMVLFISSCQHEEMPAVAKDALALLPAETPVGFRAEVKAESRTQTEAPTYAWNEAHENSNYTSAVVLAPGAIKMTNVVAGNSVDGYVTLQNLGEKFSFQLKDFNLVEGNDRWVTRWTILDMMIKQNASLKGMARLTANATTGQPELVYTLYQTGTKLTVKLVDTQGASIAIGDGIAVAADVQGSSSQYIYTDGTSNKHFIAQLQTIKTLEADEALSMDNIHMVSTPAQGGDVELQKLVDANGTPVPSGYDNVVSAVVPATPTHKVADYTPLENSGLTDADVLTITVSDTYTGLTGAQTGGTYTLKLKDVKLANGTNLTALKSGEHLTLTVTLKHNTQVSATATIGGWNEVSADVDLNDDPSFIPPYKYDADNNVYILEMDNAANDCLEHRRLYHPDADVMYKGQLAAVISGSEDPLATAIGEKSTLIITGPETGSIGLFIKENSTRSFTLLMPNVKEVDNYAFEDCTSLTSVSLPVATTIGNYAFYSCSSLSSVYLPVAATIGESAFFDCSSLSSVSLPNATIIGNYAFVGCSFLSSVSLPNATTIGNYAFYSCSFLSSVSLPKCATIGDLAFYGCSSLSSAYLPVATTVGEYAFFECTSLSTLSFATVITSIGSYAFYEVGNSVGRCDLTLKSGQTIGNPNVEGKTWANHTWKSITMK